MFGTYESFCLMHEKCINFFTFIFANANTIIYLNIDPEKVSEVSQ